MHKKSIKIITAWCFYDWACSSVSVIVTTFIFSTYFTTKIAANEIVGTYQWANATSLAGIIIAVLSPVFGAIADHGGYQKRWLFFFTAVSAASSGLLWFAYPALSAVYFTLACLIFATIGLEIASVFYNSFLPEIAPQHYLGRVSGWGWGSGYIGGIVCLAIALLVFVKFNLFSLNTHTAAQVRICGPFVAVWYILFSIPLFWFVPVFMVKRKKMSLAITEGCRELLSTLRKLPSEKNIFLFLAAHMIYADGLNTLFAFGGIYAAGTFGLSFEEVLLFGITMNITAGFGAILLSWMDDFMGSKKTVLFSLLCLTLFGIPLLFLKDKFIFWAVALILCLFVGPVQSASRSLMARLIPDKKNTGEMFGLFALSGRITAFIGPWFLGMMTLTFGSQRAGMAVVLVFFALGGLLLLPLKSEKI